MKNSRPIVPCLKVSLIVLTLCGCAASKSVGRPSVQQRFVPPPAQTLGGTGANWTALRPFPHEFGDPQVLAHAGVGDTFPVQESGGPILFEVTVLAGDDEHLVLELRVAESSTKKINLRRNQPVMVPAGYGRFEFCYPTTHVSAADPTTTSKALIIVRQCP